MPQVTRDTQMSAPLTLAVAAEMIRTKQISPLELIEQCLARIDRLDGRLRAWVVVDREQALATAKKMTDEAARGQLRGPLHGLPVGIKDIIDVEGLSTRAGSPLRENHVAQHDAPVTAGLRGAGAIILGKTVTVEFACFDPSPSRNPWDPGINDTPRHTPGGSSSGSAVAVATGMCLGALGTQTGGSLVRPSTYCGTATVKATFAAVSRDAVVPVSYHFDHVGPMARRVADLGLMLACLPRARDFGPSGGPADGAGCLGHSDSGGPVSMPAGPSLRIDPGTQHVGEEVSSKIMSSLRLGTLGGFWHETADENIRQATRVAVDKLAAAGAEIVPLEPDVDFWQIKALHRCIMSVEAAAVHREDYAARPEAYGPLLSQFLDEGLATSAVDYAKALTRLRNYQRSTACLFDDVDALIVPSTHTTAPATLETLTGTSEFQAPWSAAGVPLVSIPCGLAADGLPAAVQLVGPYHSEWQLLETAQRCETVFAFDNVPPIAREG